MNQFKEIKSVSKLVDDLIGWTEDEAVSHADDEAKKTGQVWYVLAFPHAPDDLLLANRLAKERSYSHCLVIYEAKRLQATRTTPKEDTSNK